MVFTLPDTDSDTSTDENGFYDNVQNCFYRTYTKTCAWTDSASNSYCTQFGTNISTDIEDSN